MTDDSHHLMPDVIIKVPSGPRVFIDSKFSLVAFEKYSNAERDQERVISLNDHVASMRDHLKALISKEYLTNEVSDHDFVIMFVPIEGALSVALQKDPELTTYAIQNDVAIATPTSLMIILRTIENLWKIEHRNRNADKILEKADLMHNKFVNFVLDLRSLGQRLQQAQFAYEGAMSKLQIGAGNLVSQAEKLKELSARGTRTPPEAGSLGPEPPTNEAEPRAVLAGSSLLSGSIERGTIQATPEAAPTAQQ
jgi:DNA recombination protein RmuC